MESRFRQSALSMIVFATASALSTVLMTLHVNDRKRAASSCVCDSRATWYESVFCPLLATSGCREQKGLPRLTGLGAL